MQIIKSIVRQDKNYEIAVFTNTNSVIITLNISKFRLGYMVAGKKIEEICLLYGFSIKTPKFSLFVFVDKNNIHTHNQLYAIVSSDMWHY